MSKVKNVIDKLESVGISARAIYGDMVFTISLDDNRRKIIMSCPNKDWDGVKSVSVSPKFRQAVIAVKEQDREMYSSAIRGETVKKTITQAHLKKMYIENSGPIANDIVSYQIQNLGKNLYRIKAIVAGGIQKFLVGYDEGHMFVSLLLDSSVNTVKEAHRSLIPKEIRGKKYLRQGEFFFLPVPEKQMEKVFDSIEGSFDACYNAFPLAKKSGDSDHEADLVLNVENGFIQYAFGRVTNPRHKMLRLSSWHRVFVANEAESNGIWD